MRLANGEEDDDDDKPECVCPITDHHNEEYGQLCVANGSNKTCLNYAPIPRG